MITRVSPVGNWAEKQVVNDRAMVVQSMNKMIMIEIVEYS